MNKNSKYTPENLPRVNNCQAQFRRSVVFILLGVFVAISGCNATGSSSYQYGSRSESDSVTKLGKDLAEQISKHSNTNYTSPRIALLPFIQKSSYLSAMMLEETLPGALKAEIFKLGVYEIVADRDMYRAIQQLKIEEALSKSPYLDQSQNMALGDLVSAQAVLYGTITDSGWQQWRVTLELMDIRTGKVIGAAQGVYME